MPTALPPAAAYTHALAAAAAVSYLSPQERSAATKRFLAAKQIPRDGMSREDWDCLRLAHYDELADELLALAEERHEQEAEAAALAVRRIRDLPNHLLPRGVPA